MDRSAALQMNRRANRLQDIPHKLTRELRQFHSLTVTSFGFLGDIIIIGVSHRHCRHFSAAETEAKH